MSVIGIFQQLSPGGVYCLPREHPDANLKGGDKREQETQSAADSKKCWVPTTFGKSTTEGVRKSSLNGEGLLHCPVRFEESDETNGPTESRIDGLS
jgi:hypothetical protein